MKYGTSLVVLSVALLAANAAHAQDSNFARDRNIAVTERIPPEYEPRGLRWGVFDVSPSLDIDVSRNDNIYYKDINEVSDTYSAITPAVRIASDWGRHQLTASVRSTMTNYADNDNQNTTSWEAAVGGRLDIHGRSNLFGGLSYSDGFEALYEPASQTVSTSLIKPIEYKASVVNAGFVAEGNRLRFTGQATLTDINYENAILAGGPISQDYRDYRRVEYAGHADYALSPDTALYAAWIGNTRDYDDQTINRDSDGYDVAIGASFDLTNLIRGEAQLGYQEQTYDNPAFEKVDGVSFLANIQYFPTQLLTVSAKTARTIQETPQLGASGYTSTASEIGADYELLRTLVLSASYGYTTDEYNGVDRTDDRTTLWLGAKYLVNRHIVIRGGYTYSENKSKGGDAIPGYKDNALKVSLGLQY
ncbi:outer membrane beta-barrel protein [Asticcacaulis sp.]|uniref:outer membrane beta-barrel protein n=1 Tax=Asticcacaulis sp. TaxID=1872648 RepID=UPI002BFAF7E5|nr:outer membrane beta-barrel protein [Asticcacaulis sp.]HTM82612.1 outer membrane beta-barrel protein [Asticcacaulis sp.]